MYVSTYGHLVLTSIGSAVLSAPLGYIAVERSDHYSASAVSVLSDLPESSV